MLYITLNVPQFLIYRLTPTAISIYGTNFIFPLPFISCFSKEMKQRVWKLYGSCMVTFLGFFFLLWKKKNLNVFFILFYDLMFFYEFYKVVSFHLVTVRFQSVELIFYVVILLIMTIWLQLHYNFLLIFILIFTWVLGLCINSWKYFLGISCTYSLCLLSSITIDFRILLTYG